MKMNRETIEREYPNYKKYIRNVFEAGQARIFRWWDEIQPLEKNHLLEQIASFDFQFIRKLFNASLRITHSFCGNLAPPEIIAVPRNAAEKKIVQKVEKIGKDSLLKGEVAVLTVAGGGGTRLGVDVPKGTLPIAPITRKSIFQLHAEKIQAVQKRYNIKIPWYIMTSENNDLVTRNFFQMHQFFGFDSQQICFFTQGMLPTLDLQGNLLMDSKSNIIMSPNGHGGTIIALKEKGVLDDMKSRGIKSIFYHQVDNVLIKIADPIFIGYHLRDEAEMSLKVVKKCHPEEKVGIIVAIDGRLHTIEYSELSRKDMYEKKGNGTLKYNDGNIAVHMISIDFIEKVYREGEPLPYHAVVKKVSYIDENGKMINPEENNAIKFESFIFDLLKYVKKSVIMEVIREDEFSPIKNMEGENSPTTARQDMVNLFGRWLRNMGISIPTDSHGNVIGLIDISPCFALDEEELKDKLDKHLQFNGCLSL